MKIWKKVLIGAGSGLAVLIAVGISFTQRDKGVVTVQSGKAQRLDLASVVSARGKSSRRLTSTSGRMLSARSPAVREGRDRVKGDNCWLSSRTCSPRRT